MRTVRVELGARSYDVVIGPGALATVARSLPGLLGRSPTRAFLIIDEGVPAGLVGELEAALAAGGATVGSARLDPTEPRKSLASCEMILQTLARTGQERDEPVVNIGGGIVGDVGGFVAAGYRRGVPVVQCPTTLLAMVDASVGGKTGVNLTVDLGDGGRLLKNLVGAFHQPLLVVADTRALASLTDRQFRAGLAECVKHAMIWRRTPGDGDDLLAWTESNAPAIGRRDESALTELIHRNVTLKARVVEQDERETASSDAGGRALLNLGHTFGHAIETLPGLSPDRSDPSQAPLLHGEAVALGLVAACAAAEHLGLSDASLGSRIRGLLERLGLPTSVDGMPDNKSIRATMSHDKKAKGGVLRLVLPEGPGSCRVVEAPDRAAIDAGLDAIRPA